MGSPPTKHKKYKIRISTKKQMKQKTQETINYKKKFENNKQFPKDAIDKCQYVESTWKEGLRTGHIVDLDTCNGMNNKNVNETSKNKIKDDSKVRANEFFFTKNEKCHWFSRAPLQRKHLMQRKIW